MRDPSVRPFRQQTHGYGQIHDKDSSWRNSWTVDVRVYDRQGYGLPVTICVRSGGRIGVGASAENRGASHKHDGSNCR